VLGILGLVFLIFCIGPLFAIPAVICGHKAHGRIKRSGGTLTGEGLALAGLITGYISIALALVVIPMMAAIAIPNFVKARDTAQKNICINNLRKIDAAKQQWAMDNNKTADATPTVQDLDRYIPGGMGSLRCPKEGVYTINKVNEPPTCSVPEHQLANAP
jgi:competence protein ComGC